MLQEPVVRKTDAQAAGPLKDPWIYPMQWLVIGVLAIALLSVSVVFAVSDCSGSHDPLPVSDPPEPPAPEGCPRAPWPMSLVSRPTPTSLLQTLHEVQEAVATLSAGAPGGSAIIATFQGQVLYEDMLGYANIAAPTVAPSLESVFRIGSLIKAFVGLMITMLQEQGTISIHDPVVKFWPDFAMQDPFNSLDRITLAQLSSHMAGVPRECPCQPGQCELNQTSVLERLAEWELIYPLWMTPAYSNLGTALLGHVLATAAGTS
jgi:CubicO group peptidase (beta-lactamase class C family)